MNLSFCKVLLGKLAGIYQPGESDGVELGLASDGRSGAFVFPDRGSSLKQMSHALDLSQLDRASRHRLLALFQQIPSRRCAVRLLEDGGASLFWPIDIDPRGLQVIAQMLGFNEFSHATDAYYTRLNQPACGMALEVNPGRDSRLRYYQMLHDMAQVDATCEALAESFRFSGRVVSELENAVSTFGIGQPIVVNLGATTKGELSVKLEFAGAPLSPPISALALTRNEARFWDLAAGEASALGMVSFNYLGIRYSASKPRTFTAYLDAHVLLGKAPQGRRADELYERYKAHPSVQPGLQVLLQRRCARPGYAKGNAGTDHRTDLSLRP